MTPRDPETSPIALRLDRDDGRPLASQVAAQLRDLASSKGVTAPLRLPSTRRLAADLGVARGVAEQAYDQLRAEGWLDARQGSGSWLLPVSVDAARTPPVAAQSASDVTGLVMMDAGTPWRDPRHDAAWRRAWREMSVRTPPRGYDDPRGIQPLRAAIAARLTRTRGLVVGADDVRITGGTTAGLRHLLTGLPPGAVALEDPGYRAAVLTAASVGREVRSIRPGQPVGNLTGVAAAYVTPAHQHPLGRVMPADERAALVTEARRTGTVVVEDDYDSEFRYDVAPVPALASLAPDAVAYLGTAAKSTLPSLRLGWMVLPPSLRAAVDTYREITHDAPPWPVQQAYTSLLRDGYVDAMVRSARKVYAARAPKVVAALSPYAELAGPVAGMYSAWLLDQPRAVRARDAALVAGFRINLLADYCRESTCTGLVVGFGGPDDDQLDVALGVIASALAEA